MMFSLSLTVGNVEFPIAVCPRGSRLPLVKAVLCPRSTSAACSSVLSYDITAILESLCIDVLSWP